MDKSFNISWIVEAVKIKILSISLGICEHTKRIFKITDDPLIYMVVNNTYYSENRCEEGTRCLDVRCELNKTTAASYKRGCCPFGGEEQFNMRDFVCTIAMVNEWNILLRDQIENMTWNRGEILACLEPVLKITINPKKEQKETIE